MNRVRENRVSSSKQRARESSGVGETRHQPDLLLLLLILLILIPLLQRARPGGTYAPSVRTHGLSSTALCASSASARCR